jgi:ribosome-binding protein aMBF1 (putative translation factor)
MPKRFQNPELQLQRPWMPPQPGMFALDSARVRILRRKALLRQMDVARELGISAPIITGIEHGDYFVNQYVAEQLAKVLLGDTLHWRELLAETQPEERSA